MMSNPSEKMSTLRTNIKRLYSLHSFETSPSSNTSLSFKMIYMEISFDGEIISSDTSLRIAKIRSQDESNDKMNTDVSYSLHLCAISANSVNSRRQSCPKGTHLTRKLHPFGDELREKQNIRYHSKKEKI